VVSAEPCIHLQHTQSGTAVRGQAEYLQGHVQTPGGAPGVFARWKWDGTRLTASGDRLGLSPLFVYAADTEIALSPSVVALLPIGRAAKIDASALALFLRLGFMVGDDTPFAHVHTLPPNGQLEWSDGRLTITGGYSWGSPLEISRTDALAQFGRLFARAIATRIPTGGRVVLPLSGGRDSRHILFELEQRGAAPDHCVTVPRYPPHPGEDERVARLVATAAGVPHVILPQRPRYESEVRKNLRTSFCADEHAWFMPLVDYLETNADIVYDGLGGSLYVGARFTSESSHAAWRAGRSREVAQDVLDRFSIATEPALNAVLAPEWRRRLSHEVALARLETEIARHADAPDPAKSFHFWSRLRRELALVPFGLMRAKTVFAPLVDHDLYDFITGLSPEVIAPSFSRTDRTFHDEALRMAYPQYAKLPFQDRAAPSLNAAMHHVHFAVRTVGAVAVARTPFLPRMSAVTRLLRCVIDPRYRESMSWLPGLALYLTQLGALTDGSARGAES
jgi:asparagine synthase (glutamine-hydrolysing)